MKCLRKPGSVIVGLFLIAGCNSNTAPGNDREARFDPAPTAAQAATAGAAIDGVEVSLLKPEILTDADLSRVPAIAGQCIFRFSKVGYPVFVYPSSGQGPSTIKINGRLVSLGPAGDGRYGSDGMEAVIRDLAAEGRTSGRSDAEFVVRFPGAPNELGYRGFSECS